MLITVREASPCPRCLWLNNRLVQPSSSSSICRATLSIRRTSNISSTNPGHLSTSGDLPNFDPLGINSDDLSSSTWQNLVTLFSQSSEKEKPRGVAAAIEDSSIDFGDFFKGPLPGKFLKLLGFLALSRLGVYIPLGGVNREAFLGNLDQNSLLTTLDSFSGGGIGRLGLCSLGIVPFINAQIVFQLLAQVYPKLQDLQKREGEAGRKKILQYTRYASVGFAIVQAIGQVLFLRPYVNDFTTEWALTSVILLTLGSVFTTYIGEQITELKLGNGTSLLIFTNIISYLPASFGRTFAQAFNDANYVGLVTIILSFFLLVVGNLPMYQKPINLHLYLTKILNLNQFLLYHLNLMFLYLLHQKLLFILNNMLRNNKKLLLMKLFLKIRTYFNPLHLSPSRLMY